MRGQRDERRTPYQSREHAGVGGRQLRITVTTIMGQATPLDVQSTDTIGAIKSMIQERNGVPVARQRLVFDDTPQDNRATLGGIGVADGATIHLIMQADQRPSEGLPVQVGDVIQVFSQTTQSWHVAVVCKRLQDGPLAGWVSVSYNADGDTRDKEVDPTNPLQARPAPRYYSIGPDGRKAFDAADNALIAQAHAAGKEAVQLPPKAYGRFEIRFKPRRGNEPVSGPPRAPPVPR